MKRWALIAAGALALAGCSDSSGTEEATPEETTPEATEEVTEAEEPTEDTESTTDDATEKPAAPTESDDANGTDGSAVSHDCASVTLPAGMSEDGNGVWTSDGVKAELICLDVHSAGEAKGKRVGEIKRNLHGDAEVRDVEVREDHYSFRIELPDEVIHEYGVFSGGQAAILSWTGDDEDFRMAADTLEVK